MELVRISTAGSVDDGKSTLIGRLLYDNNALTKEQEELVRKKTLEKGWDDLDLSVITDGLVAEREQGITIDVANIYFSTKSHKFIIADSPGHVEYTRNMVTGASTAEVSIILVDARKGLLEQSFRHFYISQLLKLEKVVFCVNKMDLVDYDEDQFLKIAIEIKEMVTAFDASIEYHIVPTSSLKGDNVVAKSIEMPWYKGPTLNEFLHQSTIEKDNDLPFRFDVQQVYHVQNETFTDYRGYAGRVISGKVSVGDTITVLPSGKQSTITEIRKYTSELKEATQGESISVSLKDEIDISRGAVFAEPNAEPSLETSVQATLVWMDERSGVIGGKYIWKSGSREFPAKIQQLNHKIDPTEPQKQVEATGLGLNDIGQVMLKLSQPVLLDPYVENKQNGVFILIDPQTNNTIALGFIK